MNKETENPPAQLAPLSGLAVSVPSHALIDTDGAAPDPRPDGIDSAWDIVIPAALLTPATRAFLDRQDLPAWRIAADLLEIAATGEWKSAPPIKAPWMRLLAHVLSTQLELKPGGQVTSAELLAVCRTSLAGAATWPGDRAVQCFLTWFLRAMHGSAKSNDLQVGARVVRGWRGIAIRNPAAPPS